MILVGDLNLNLDSCENEWDDLAILQLLVEYFLCDMHRHFKQGPRQSSTWYQKRNEVLILFQPGRLFPLNRLLYPFPACARGAAERPLSEKITREKSEKIDMRKKARHLSLFNMP